MSVCKTADHFPFPLRRENIRMLICAEGNQRGEKQRCQVGRVAGSQCGVSSGTESVFQGEQVIVFLSCAQLK